MDIRTHDRSLATARGTLFGLAGLLAVGCAIPSATRAADCAQPTANSDLWIDASLEAAYLFNPHLNGFSIDTEVSDGVVTLSGIVRSDIDKDLAGEIAKSLAGVESVKNELEVNAEFGDDIAVASDSDQARGFLQKVSDATTTAKVKTRLIANEHVSAGEIDVDTENKVVRLSGTVGSTTEKQLAEFLAKNTSGVESVLNDLQIRPKTS